MEQHFEHLQKTLNRLAEYGFVVNNSKNQLFLEEVLFLGYRVSGEGIQIDSKKIDEVITFQSEKILMLIKMK